MAGDPISRSLVASAQEHKEFVDETEHILYLLNPCVDLVLAVTSIVAPILSLLVFGLFVFLAVFLIMVMIDAGIIYLWFTRRDKVTRNRGA